MNCFQQLDDILAKDAQLNDAFARNDPLEAIRQRGCPSVSIAVLSGRQISTHCYSNVQDDTETMFQACSLSKPICGLITIRMVDQGRLDLDRPITQYLDEDTTNALARTATKKELLSQVTIAHLLSHTSGLGFHSANGYTGENGVPTIDQIIKGGPGCNTVPLVLNAAPGAAYLYSGGGFVVLQKILETISSKPFAELAEEVLFTPLGMKRSTFDLPTSKYAHAHYSGTAACEKPYLHVPEKAAAGLWTTPSDMMKAISAVQQSLDEGNLKPFISRDLALRMLTEIRAGMALSWRAPRSPGLGFGHTGDSYPGWTSICFGFADLRSLLGADQKRNRRIPENSGICILTNSRIGAPLYRSLFAALSYLLDWPYVADLKNASSRFLPLPHDRSLNIDLADWLGDFEDEWKLRRDGKREERFVAVRGFGPMLPLFPAATPNDDPDSAAILVAGGLNVWLELRTVEDRKQLEVWSQDTDGECTVSRLSKLS